MATQGTTTARLELLLRRLRQGDEAAKSELVAYATKGIRAHVSRQFSEWRKLHRWVEKDDIAQDVATRLLKALEDVKPNSVKGLFGLVGILVHRVLEDHKRHWFGPKGPGRHHHSDPPRPNTDIKGRPLHDKADSTEGPGTKVERKERYELAEEAVEDLSSSDKEIIDLRCYAGLSLLVCAEVLEVTHEAAKKRWQAAKVRWKRAIKRRGGKP